MILSGQRLQNKGLLSTVDLEMFQYKVSLTKIKLHVVIFTSRFYYQNSVFVHFLSRS